MICTCGKKDCSGERTECLACLLCSCGSTQGCPVCDNCSICEGKKWTHASAGE